MSDHEAVPDQPLEAGSFEEWWPLFRTRAQDGEHAAREAWRYASLLAQRRAALVHRERRLEAERLERENAALRSERDVLLEASRADTERWIRFARKYGTLAARLHRLRELVKGQGAALPADVLLRLRAEIEAPL